MPAPALLPGPAPARRAPPGECLFMCDIGPKVLGPVFKPKGFKVTSSTAPGLIIYIASYFDRCVPPIASRLPIASSGCGRVAVWLRWVAVWLRSGCGCVAPPLRQCLKRLAFCGGLCAAFCLRRPPLPEARQNLVRGGSGGVRHRKIKLDLSLSGASRWHSLDLPGSGSSGSAPAGSARVPDCGNHGGWKHGKHGRTIAANAAALLTWRRR